MTPAIVPDEILNFMDAPILGLRGVGSDRAAQLARLEIHTVGGLLLHRPRRYEDRRGIRAVRDLVEGEPALVRGRVADMGVKYWQQRQRSRFELVLDDGERRLHCRWWNAAFMARHFAVGDELVVYGKVRSLKPPTIDHPETEHIEAGEEAFIHVERIVPVYPLTEHLPQRVLRSIIWRTLEQFQQALDSLKGDLPGDAPGTGAAGFLPRNQALRVLHFPSSLQETAAARRRLALDELFAFQSELQARRLHLEMNVTGWPCGGDNRLIKPFLAGLGFTLTKAQTRVLREVRHDLRGPRPMRRLLQGDVGAGKTVVAASAILMALESGCSAALMAPTEILAEQHALTFRRWLEPLGIETRLHTGGHKDPAPRTRRSPSLLWRSERTRCSNRVTRLRTSGWW